MISARVTPNGAFLRLLNMDHVEVQAAICAALNETALVGQALIVEDTPVDTANLRNNIAVDPATPDHLEATIHTGTVPYAAYVEYGTGIYGEGPGAKGQPFTVTAKGGALKFTSGGDTFFRKSVTIQGMRPRAMFRKNIPAIHAYLEGAMRRHVGALI